MQDPDPTDCTPREPIVSHRPGRVHEMHPLLVAACPDCQAPKAGPDFY